MKTFVDTSALLALLDADDADHAAASDVWDNLTRSRAALATTNYVLVETWAVCQRRLGVLAARVLQEDFAPVLDIEWVTQQAHQEASGAALAANRRDLSLVDCVSFQMMRRLGIRRAFTLDEHFREQGFEVVP